MDEEVDVGLDGAADGPATAANMGDESPFQTVLQALGPAGELLEKGGFAIWAIAALSVITVAVILWKLWRLSYYGVWRHSRAETAVRLWLDHCDDEAFGYARSGRGVRARVAAVAIQCAGDRLRPIDAGREETIRVAKSVMAETRSGLRALELIATIAPLLGLFGTVLGMIAAFQELQASGSRADPSALAGGIWEALLTTAAGMAVAIPASAALTWFESIADRLRHDLEDIATRIFVRPERASYAHAAE